MKYKIEDQPSTNQKRCFQVLEGKEDRNLEEKETAEMTKKRKMIKIEVKRMY